MQSSRLLRVLVAYHRKQFQGIHRVFRTPFYLEVHGWVVGRLRQGGRVRLPRKCNFGARDCGGRFESVSCSEPHKEGLFHGLVTSRRRFRRPPSSYLSFLDSVEVLPRFLVFFFSFCLFPHRLSVHAVSFFVSLYLGCRFLLTLFMVRFVLGANLDIFSCLHVLPGLVFGGFSLFCLEHITCYLPQRSATQHHCTTKNILACTP